MRGGLQPEHFRVGEVRGVGATRPAIPERIACPLLQVSRSALQRMNDRKLARATLIEEFGANLEPLIRLYSMYRYRRQGTLVCHRPGQINIHKAVYRA